MYTEGMPSGTREVRDWGRVVASILSRARDERGLSYRAIGTLSGVQYTQVQRMITGKKVMTLDEFVAIAEALGLVPVEVLREAEERLAAEAGVGNITELSASAVAVDVGAGGVVVPMRRRGVYGSGQVVEELPEGALERAAAQVVEGDVEDEVGGFGRRP